MPTTDIDRCCLSTFAGLTVHLRKSHSGIPYSNSHLIYKPKTLSQPELCYSIENCSNSNNMATQKCFVFLVALLLGQISARKIHYIHWNRANPMFRLDNTDHIVDVNSGNLPWEYDQVNIICPVSKSDVKYPERHVIYSVSREEFDSCRITNPKPRIVAVCSKPHQLLYFTITFRLFTPTPGGLEFHPGQDYYFISTSSKEDLHRRVGGGCSTHNMKMIFKVSDNGADHANINAPRGSNEVSAHFSTTSTTTTTTTPKPIVRFNSKVPNQRGGDYIYYYHPRDLIEMEGNSLKTKKGGYQSRGYDNDVWKNEAMRYSSGSSTLSVLSASLLASLLVVLVQLR
jgi:ephrin-B